jgi:hypothetical protein
MTTTPREPEPKQRKNGGAIVAGHSTVARTAKAQSADDAVKWWRAFRRFMADANALKEYYDGLRQERMTGSEYPRTAADLEEDAKWCQGQVAKCRAGFERYDPDSNYEADEDGENVLKTAHIATRLGVMMGGFMSALPQSPELFARAMVEQVADIEGLTTVALETACREIVATEKWPDISKVVKVISEHVGQWFGRRAALNAERARLELIPVLVEREQKKQKEEHEQAIHHATHQLTAAMTAKHRLADEIEAARAALAKEIEKRNAALAKLVEQYAQWEQRESERMRALCKLTGSDEGMTVTTAPPSASAGNGAAPIAAGRSAEPLA